MKLHDDRDGAANHFASLMLGSARRPTLILVFDLGVSRSNSSRTPAVQILRTTDDGDGGDAMQPSASMLSPPPPPTRPALWAIHSRGHDEAVFGCLKRLGMTEMLPGFWAAVTADEEAVYRNNPKQLMRFRHLAESFRHPEGKVAR
jgi:hypothetical protein